MDTRAFRRLRPANPVGDLLRGWRTRRALSQAELAFEAGISIKHLSYVETGKAAPGRDILLQLSSALDLSLRDRNALLEAGGFARQYGERDLAAPELADARRAIDLLLSRHEPFPAIVTDLDERGARIQLRDLPVVARVVAHAVAPGDAIVVKLTAIDPVRRSISFTRMS